MQAIANEAKADIADDLEWPLNVISGTKTGSLSVSQTYSIYNVYLYCITTVGRHMYIRIISTVVFDQKDCYVMLSATS